MEALKDPGIQRFVQAETQKQKFQNIVNMLTSDCFDTCVDYPGQKLGSRAEKCITNCVERLIDTNNFVMNRMAKLPTPTTSEINFD